ncbi:GNAT family N-acetyltransferase [Taibaiella koreensis]|uniref:GNAT family N-acetyltransferase n=1 Tax=Taibaiella koreensis TaxID=1268548 RepID=UPI000E59CEC6|nr:GNAT family protein [Taibaiella koreensis]
MFSLETPRLLLRDIAIVDVPAIHALHSLPETDQYNTMGIPAHIGVTNDLVRTWLTTQEAVPRVHFILAVTLKDTGQFAGLFGMILAAPKKQSAEVWYKLHKDRWRSGYTSEALDRILQFAFEVLALHRVEAGCAVDNAGSIRVLEKAGMLREGHRRNVLPIRGQWVDCYEYAILEEDYFARKKS